VKKIFELKTMTKCYGNTVSEIRNFALDFINLTSKQTKPKNEQERYMLDQIYTEFLSVLICTYKTKESGIKEPILNVIFLL
jgi:hypothetical protein